MAIIRKTVSGLKPDSNYLFAVKPKNTEISASDEIPDSIRIKTPSSTSIPSTIASLQVQSNFESVMFIFQPVTDQDFSEYEYEIYDGATTSSNLVSTGRKRSTVFVVSVANSTRTVNATTGVETVTNTKYYGRVRAINTSGNAGTWTSLVTHSGNTPLITDQYIGSLTAGKITTGLMTAEQVILQNASGTLESYTPTAGMSVIRSSNFKTGPLGTGAGWIIRGDGTAEFDAASIRGTLSANSIFINANNRWARNAANNASNLEFVVGNATNQLYWNPTGGTDSGSLLKVGNSTNYMQWDNNTLTVTGAITTSATITSSSAGGIGIGTSSLYFGANQYANANTPFYVDTSSRFSLGDKLYFDGTNLTVTGTINAAGGTFSGSITATGTITGGTLTGATIQNVSGASPTFRVTSDGNVAMNNILATGSLGGSDTGLQIRADGTSLGSGSNQITATSGSIFIYHGSNASHQIRLGESTQYFYINQLKSQPTGPANVTRLQSSVNAIQIDARYTGIGGRPSNSRVLLVHGDISLAEPIDGDANCDFLSVDISSTASTGNPIHFKTISGNTGLFGTNSLRSGKENIDYINDSETISIIKKLTPRKYTVKPDNPEDELEVALKSLDIFYGFVAEEVEESVPQLATYRTTKEFQKLWPNINIEDIEKLPLTYYKETSILSLCVSSIQNLLSRVEYLEAQLAAQ